MLTKVAPMWKVHEDVLKMAKTKEQREAIKWFHSRTVFFNCDLAEGLVLARESEHPDARFLVSLFPEVARGSEARAVSWRKETSRAACAGRTCAEHSRMTTCIFARQRQAARGQWRYTVFI